MAKYSIKLDLRNYSYEMYGIRGLDHAISRLSECDVEIELVNFLDFIGPRSSRGFDDLHEVIYLLPRKDEERKIAKFKIKLDLARLASLVNSNDVGELFKELNRKKVDVELIYPETAKIEAEEQDQWLYYLTDPIYFQD